MEEFDAIVLGAGAAGCMAAFQAAKRGKRVLLLDSGKRVGGKIPISGGGRCNFTNRGAADGHYLSANPRFCRSALARFNAKDTEAWIRDAGIAYHEKTLGQLFCDGSAMQVVELLERELDVSAVNIKLSVAVEQVERLGAIFEVVAGKERYRAPALVVALGGLSYPSLGATDLGLQIAQQFGLRLVETAPALDGFVFDTQDQKRFEGLQGLAVDAILHVGKKRFQEALLFTHTGLSGPVALQASLYWRPGEPLLINLWPGQDATESLLQTKREKPLHHVGDWLQKRWPQRLSQRWQALFLPGDEPFSRLSDKDLRAFGAAVQSWSLKPHGTAGYHKAEVTRGGVDTRDLDSKTLGARDVPGLYFCGEVVDVTGELGGYNFQWAWASGHAVGMAL